VQTFLPLPDSPPAQRRSLGWAGRLPPWRGDEALHRSHQSAAAQGPRVVRRTVHRRAGRPPVLLADDRRERAGV